MLINTLDSSIIIFYCLVILVLGVYISRSKKRTTHEYFQAGGKLPWFIVGASFVATGMNTEQLVGMVGMGYEHGLVIANWDWLFFPIYTLLIWVFLPIYLRGKVSTIPEYLENRFHPSCRNILAVVVVLGYVFINLSTVFYAGGLIIQEIIGFPIVWAIVGLALIAAVHTTLGGLETVAWINLLQFFILLIGGILLFSFGLHTMDGGVAEMIGSDPARSHLIQPASHPLIPWTSLIIAVVTVGIWYSCTNQFLVQQCLGAKSEWDARMGIILAGFVTFFRPVVEVFPGLIAHHLYDLDKPDLAFTTLLQDVVPAGIRGIIVAGILAAILSTIESILNATSTIFTLDIYKKIVHKSASQKQLVSVGRITMLTVTIIAAAWAPQIGGFESIFVYFQKFISYLATPMAAVFLMGMLWRRTTWQAALTVMIVGIPISFFLEAFVLPEGFNFFNLVGVTWVICVAILIVISLLTKAPSKEATTGTLWNKSMLSLPQAEGTRMPLHRRPSFWWGGVTILWVLLYIILW